MTPVGPPAQRALPESVCLLTSVASTALCVGGAHTALKGRAIYCDTKEALIGRVCFAHSLAVSSRVNRCVSGARAAAFSGGQVLVTSYIGRTERTAAVAGTVYQRLTRHRQTHTAVLALSARLAFSVFFAIQ